MQSVIRGTVSGSRGEKYGQATVVVVDNEGSFVQGVTVTGTFSGSFNESASGLTNGAGMAVLVTTSTTKKPSFTFCVDMLSRPLPHGATADAADCVSY